MTTLNEARNATFEAQHAAQQAAVLEHWFSLHPKYACDANRQILKQFFNGDDYTLPSLDEAVTYLGEGPSGGKLAVLPVERREENAEEAEACLTAETKAENKRRNEMTKEELVALARAERPIPTAPVLPAVYRSFDISTPEALRKIAKEKFLLFREITARFGSELVNQRLGVVKQQVGRPIDLGIGGN